MNPLTPVPDWQETSPRAKEQAHLPSSSSERLLPFIGIARNLVLGMIILMIALEFFNMTPGILLEQRTGYGAARGQSHCTYLTLVGRQNSVGNGWILTFLRSNHTPGRTLFAYLYEESQSDKESETRAPNTPEPEVESPSTRRIPLFYRQ